MWSSHLDLKLDVIEEADNSRFANSDDIRLVNPIASFSNYKLTTSSGKQLEDISHAHIVPLRYKLITYAKDFDDLSIRFDLDCVRRRELTNNKNIKGEFDIKVMLKDVFGFAEYHEKVTNCLNYQLTLTRNEDAAALHKAVH